MRCAHSADARRCLAGLVPTPGSIPREFRRARGGRLYGCDDCQEVCPVGRSEVIADGTEDPAADVEAIDVLEADGADLLERFGRWCVAARPGTTADGCDPAGVRLREAFLADPDPVLRSHATWAAAELGRRDLLGGLDDDEDPLVAEEMALIRGRVGT